MTTLRIYDLKGELFLALDLRHLLDILAPRSLHAEWVVLPVKSRELGREWFEATGEGGEKLEKFSEENTSISGVELTALANRTQQVIWGEFIGSLSTSPDGKWVIIRAIDSTFYEITTLDETVLDKIKSSFTDVRPMDLPFDQA